MTMVRPQVDCTREGGRADEGGGLENRLRGDPYVGSNPTPPATETLTQTLEIFQGLDAVQCGRNGRAPSLRGSADGPHRRST